MKKFKQVLGITLFIIPLLILMYFLAGYKIILAVLIGVAGVGLIFTWLALITYLIGE